MEDNNQEEDKKYISKIKLPSGETYDIKDAFLRHQLNVLLGIEDPDDMDI